MRIIFRHVCAMDEMNPLFKICLEVVSEQKHIRKLCPIRSDKGFIKMEIAMGHEAYCRDIQRIRSIL